MATEYASNSQSQRAYCPLFHHTVELIGRRWTGVILLAMRSGLDRFSEIRDAIPGLSDRLLSERLRELEHEGLVERSEDHGQVRYWLSEAGAELSPVVDAIQDWTRRWGTPRC